MEPTGGRIRAHGKRLAKRVDFKKYLVMLENALCDFRVSFNGAGSILMRFSQGFGRLHFREICSEVFLTRGELL